MPTIEQKLLRFLDGNRGGYEREKACECPKEQLRSFKTTLAEFPLYTEGCRKGCLGCGVVLALAFVAVIVVAIFALLPLAIAIPVGVFLFFCSFCGISFFFVLPQNQHRYVTVEFKCLQCEHVYTMLYDCITLRKRERCGHYTKPCAILDVSETERSYGFVEAMYGEMRDGLDKMYYPGSYNCKTWADDFYRKIC